MSPLSRRAFLRQTAVAAGVSGFAASSIAKLHARPYDWPIGIELFPLGKLIDTDFPGTMKQVADAGFQTVEIHSPWYNKHNFGFTDMMKHSGAEIQKILGDVGLKATSAHVDMTECRGEELPKIIEWAKERGVTQIAAPSLDGPTRPPDNTPDTVKRLADEYNHAGEMAARAGIQVALHTEGFELSMIDGKRVMDHLFNYLDPNLVKFQFQMSTITSGLVAADYFSQHPGWFVSMHLQDLDMNAPPSPPPAPAPGAPAGRAGRGGGRPQVPIGKGSIDWVKTFQAAKIGGVKNYFVEQQFELAKQGVPFLEQLNV